MTDDGRGDPALLASLPEPASSLGPSGDDPAHEAIQDWLVENCGRGLPYVNGTDLHTALHGLAYTLRQIEACRNYRPHIGQSRPASTSIRWALEYIAANEMRRRDGIAHPLSKDSPHA